MGIQNSGNTRPVSADAFRFTPYYRGDNVTAPEVSTTKGTDIMLGMLLDQYTQSPILLEYFGAFFEEMNTLFNQVDSVYVGRMLDYAQGAQLDVIGRIINQSRQVSLPNIYFGFDGATDADQMADEASPADGGVFKSEAEEGFTDTPLDDTTYRRLMKAKALVHTRHECSINLIYHASYTLLNRIPRKMHVNKLATQELDLVVSREDVTAREASLLLYLAQYMVPLGTSLVVTREVLI